MNIPSSIKYTLETLPPFEEKEAKKIVADLVSQYRADDCREVQRILTSARIDLPLEDVIALVNEELALYDVPPSTKYTLETLSSLDKEEAKKIVAKLVSQSRASDCREVQRILIAARIDLPLEDVVALVDEGLALYK